MRLCRATHSQHIQFGGFLSFVTPQLQDAGDDVNPLLLLGLVVGQLVTVDQGNGALKQSASWQ
jgi:hypothetical protein